MCDVHIKYPFQNNSFVWALYFPRTKTLGWKTLCGCNNVYIWQLCVSFGKDYLMFMGHTSFKYKIINQYIKSILHLNFIGVNWIKQMKSHSMLYLVPCNYNKPLFKAMMIIELLMRKWIHRMSILGFAATSQGHFLWFRKFRSALKFSHNKLIRQTNE